MLKEQRNFSKVNQLIQQELSTIMQNVNIERATIGLHPDFQYLKGTDDSEMHYIVSIFIDIEGSTTLHNEYELDEIFEITNTVQTAAIHTCLAMGGHVQRLQGDGVFAYFGGKTISKENAVQSAMIACSMFTYFVKNDLKNIFLQDEIEDIKTRIGVDFGDDPDVMWANFGVANVSELTTLSLHTSLASKMQSEATPNGIVAGQYIKDRMKSSETFFDYVTNSKGEIKRYIFQNEKKGFRYTQYAFNWYGFLKSLPFVGSDANGNLYLIKPGAPSIVQPATAQQKDYAALGALIGNTKPYKL
jgi:class 3 adenylate cyclase